MMANEELTARCRLPDEPMFFDELELHRLMIHCSRIGASDIKIQSTNAISAKVDGQVIYLTRRNLPPSEVESMLSVIYGAGGPARIKSGNAIDKAYELRPQGEDRKRERFRFRVNAVGGTLQGIKAIEITMRTIVIDPPDMNKVGLEDEIRANGFPKDGIFIMAGATGSGKSTTLASMMRFLLEMPDGNRFVMTFEAPIEYVYDSVIKPSSTIFQTEIGEDADLKSFADGIRSAMRRAPDVILNGEMRDPETVEQTIAAALSGHAVYTTVHATSVPEIFPRVINFFPPASRQALLSDLLANTRMLVWQTLVPKAGGKGRVPIREFLTFDRAIRTELLEVAAAHSTERMLIRLRELVDEKGQSRMACAQRHLDAGNIDQDAFLAMKSFG